jgi:hypothetical protein
MRQGSARPVPTSRHSGASVLPCGASPIGPDCEEVIPSLRPKSRIDFTMKSALARVAEAAGIWGIHCRTTTVVASPTVMLPSTASRRERPRFVHDHVGVGGTASSHAGRRGLVQAVPDGLSRDVPRQTAVQTRVVCAARVRSPRAHEGARRRER